VAGLLYLRPLNFEMLKGIFQLPELWIATVVAHQLTTFLTAVRWRVLIGNTGLQSPSVGRLFFVVWASQFTAIIPLGFEVTRFAYMLKALKMTARQASRTTVVDRVFELAGLLSVLGFTFLGFHLGWVAFIFLFAVFFLKSQTRTLFLVSAFKHALKAAVILVVIWKPQELEFSLVMEMAYKTMFGLLGESLPVSWNGLGTGHLAFEFQIPGKGAEIYSLFFAAKTVLNFLGIFPLMWLVQKQTKSTLMLQK
jgi:hypothetical protein